MIKKKAKRQFALIILSVILGIILTLAQFNIPFTNHTYNGFLNSIDLGNDLSSGIAVVYDIHQKEGGSLDFNSDLNKTINKLQSIILEKGYPNALVVKQLSGGVTQIRIEVLNADVTKDIFTLLGQPSEIEIKKEQGEDKEAQLKTEHIADVTTSHQRGVFGFSVKLTQAGQDILTTLTSQTSLYTYVNGNLVATQFLATTDEIFIPTSATSGDQAERYAATILGAILPVRLELVENSILSPLLGKNVLTIGLISFAVALVIMFVLLYVRYGIMGLLTSLALAIYFILILFFLQAIPLIQLNLYGIVGVVLGFILVIYSNIIIMEKVIEEYRLNKKIPASVKSAFEKTKTVILDTSIVLFLISAVTYFTGNNAIQMFSLVLLTSVLVSLLVTLILNKKMFHMYLTFNSVNAKPYKLKREGSANEISK